MNCQARVAVSTDEAVDMAMDAYVYGYPLVLMDLTREMMTATAKYGNRATPVNQFLHTRQFPDPSFPALLRPNVDTLYSTAWIDLARGPVLLNVPAMSRYYVIQLMDAWTNVFASLGTRTTGNHKQDFVIVRQGWNGTLPGTAMSIQAPTRFVWLIGRTQTNGREDYDAVHAIQNQYQLTSLLGCGAYTSRNGTTTQEVAISETPVQRIARMDANTFFSRLNILMKDNPPAGCDCPTLKRCSAVGVAPGIPFNVNALGAAAASCIEASVRAAHYRILLGARRPLGRNVNGWCVLPRNTGQFGADYMWRAVVAMGGLGANLLEDTFHLHALVDSDGHPLNGKSSYIIRFQKRQLPPVNAFWSLTAYNEEESFVSNRIRRYAIGNRVRLAYNLDGSLCIQLCHASPGKETKSNWLPTPFGPFHLLMRLYWSKTPVVTGAWKPPAIEKR